MKKQVLWGGVMGGSPAGGVWRRRRWSCQCGKQHIEQQRSRGADRPVVRGVPAVGSSSMPTERPFHLLGFCVPGSGEQRPTGRAGCAQSVDGLSEAQKHHGAERARIESGAAGKRCVYDAGVIGCDDRLSWARPRGGDRDSGRRQRCGDRAVESGDGHGWQYL